MKIDITGDVMARARALPADAVRAESDGDDIRRSGASWYRVSGTHDG